MGFIVRLESGTGRVLGETGQDEALERVLPDAGDRAFACWRFIDPYGDTVFNRLQMGAFLEELELLRAAVGGDPRHQASLDRVRDLAQRCRAGAHLYLRFVGD